MNIEESIKILDKFTTEHKLFNIKHSDGLEEAIETLLTAYEKQSKEIEELSKLKDKLVKEYEAAQEGFIKKQIPTSVVDGTIVQEVGWILNEIDKILKKAESISYKEEGE